MKISILGAGLIGVASAYYLWRDGHEVELIDALPEAAGVTSYANAGLIAASRALPWPNPAVRGTLTQAARGRGGALRVERWFDPPLWRWGREFLRYCNAAEFARLSAAKLGFARFCQHELEATLAATGVTCDYRRDGLLYPFQSAATAEAARARAATVAAHGCELRLLSRDEAIALEGALAASPIIGASYAATDAQGDSRAFTRALARWLAARDERALRLRFGERVEASIERGRLAIRANGAPLSADAFVVALGPATPAFAHGIGRRVPIYPVQGYSLTVPLRDATRAPTRGGICEDSLVAWCPLGEGADAVMRLTTGAVFRGQRNAFGDADFAHHREHFERLFPGALDWSHAGVERWACQRPMTPSSLPILQRDPQHERLYWNCGQGHIGWTMCCGSGRIVADLIGGRTPSFPLADMQRL